MTPGGFYQLLVRRLGIEQGVDKGLLIAAAKLNDVQRFEGSDGRLVNTADDEICLRDPAQRRSSFEEILLVGSDSCLKPFGRFGDRHSSPPGYGKCSQLQR